jgi:hypothetical protein
MRFYFHVSDMARDIFDLDWRGREFDSVYDALSHAQSLRSELFAEPEFQAGYIIVSDDDAARVSVLEV